MGLRAITRNKRHVANVYEALIAAKRRTPSTDAYKKLITTIAPAAVTSSIVHDHSSTASWHATGWAAAAFLAGTTTVALSEPEAAPPPSADTVGSIKTVL